MTAADAEKVDQSQWKGQNLLGKALVKVRDELLGDEIHNPPR